MPDEAQFGNIPCRKRIIETYYHINKQVNKTQADLFYQCILSFFVPLHLSGFTFGPSSWGSSLRFLIILGGKGYSMIINLCDLKTDVHQRIIWDYNDRDGMRTSQERSSSTAETKAPVTPGRRTHGDFTASKTNSERCCRRSGISLSADGSPRHLHWTPWDLLCRHATAHMLCMHNVGMP